jgi:hypothetical protein
VSQTLVPARCWLHALAVLVARQSPRPTRASDWFVRKLLELALHLTVL